jgi:hypothetical protein
VTYLDWKRAQKQSTAKIAAPDLNGKHQERNQKLTKPVVCLLDLKLSIH